MLRRRIFCVICVILSAALCLCGCASPAGHGGAANATQSEAVPAFDPATAEKLGEGEKQFYFTVTFDDGAVKAYDIATDADTVGEALAALALVEGEQTNYGLYVKTIGGVRADYNTDHAYWAFYIDGEYAMTGVDATELVPGSTYSFVYTPADQFR